MAMKRLIKKSEWVFSVRSYDILTIRKTNTTKTSFERKEYRHSPAVQLRAGFFYVKIRMPWSIRIKAQQTADSGDRPDHRYRFAGKARRVAVSNLKQDIAEKIAQTISAVYPDAQGLPEDLSGLLEVPPDPKMGDYAFPCFKLSRSLRKAPPMIAQSLGEAFDAPDLARAECAGG